MEVLKACVTVLKLTYDMRVRVSQERVRVLTGQLEKAKHELQTPSAEPTRESLIQQKAALEKELMASNAKRVDAQVPCFFVCPQFGASREQPHYKMPSP